MQLLASSSQAGGFFTGLYSPENIGKKYMARVDYSYGNWKRLRRATELGHWSGITANQVALAWVLHQPLNVFALIGPATVAELDDCLGALDVEGEHLADARDLRLPPHHPISLAAQHLLRSGTI